MRKIFSTLFLALAGFCCATVLQARPQVLEADRIVAVVGSEAITLSELRSRLQSVTAQLQRQGTPLPPPEVLERQMLERMIMDRAQLQAAAELGIKVDDAQLEQTIARIAANNKLTLAQFKAALQKDGIAYPRFREEIRDEIIISRLRDREVDSRLVVSDAEIDNYLAQTGAGQAQEEYQVAHILLRAPESASPEQLQKLKAKAEGVLKRAREGENFAELAAAYSDAPDALQGGNLGWRPLERMPALFAEAAARLQKNQVSGLLRSSNGFHIIKLVDKRGGQQVDGGVRQTRARHILLRVNEVMSEGEARRRLEDLRQRLRHGADFAELARLHSQDGSAAKGGDLGWVNPGDTVPEFERAMDALQEGEVSEVIQSPFGFHLIKVEERRVQDMSQEKQRLAARQALRERKMDEAYQDWLRQLRDKTYVEYRLEDQ
ncbi:peptidylprolyl isomerase [Azovibrio restrictus]|uniref:peptidylprolyl isomerase n=1 Tax=Azovibrio restrictus TaxID=146938 RepID=UPI0026F2C3BD|nr:peptidylprolyl isomerase [Azovibrio restrictus]